MATRPLVLVAILTGFCPLRRRGPTAPRKSARAPSWCGSVELGGDRDQLLQVFYLAGALQVRSSGLQGLDAPGPVEDGLGHFRDGSGLGYSFSQPVDQRAAAADRCGLTGPPARGRRSSGRPRRRGQGDVLLLGVGGTRTPGPGRSLPRWGASRPAAALYLVRLGLAISRRRATAGHAPPGARRTVVPPDHLVGQPDPDEYLLLTSWTACSSGCYRDLAWPRPGPCW